MSQMSFAEIDFGSHRKVTRRAKFLEEMESALPWDQPIGLVKSFYPESGKVGRQPIDLGLMVRAYFVQQWYDLFDPALEEELNESLTNPLSPPWIPSISVIHGLSAKSKFLATGYPQFPLFTAFPPKANS